jgi:hypothetical protein
VLGAERFWDDELQPVREGAVAPPGPGLSRRGSACGVSIRFALFALARERGVVTKCCLATFGDHTAAARVVVGPDGGDRRARGSPNLCQDRNCRYPGAAPDGEQTSTARTHGEPGTAGAPRPPPASLAAVRHPERPRTTTAMTALPRWRRPSSSPARPAQTAGPSNGGCSAPPPAVRAAAAPGDGGQQKPSPRSPLANARTSRGCAARPHPRGPRCARTGAPKTPAPS